MCNAVQQEMSVQVSPQSQQIVEISIEGMTCSACSGTIENELRSTNGVVSVAVQLLLNKATVVFQKERISSEDIAEAIEDVGFGANILSVKEVEAPSSSNDQVAELAIGGMTCSACSGAIEAELRNTRGVSKVSVQLLLNRATVHFDAKVISAEKICEAIEDIGFEAATMQVKDSANVRSNATLHIKFQGPPGDWKSVKGIRSCTATGDVFRVDYDPFTVGARDILSQLNATRQDGATDDSELRAEENQKRVKKNFFRSLFPALVVFVLVMLIPAFSPDMHHDMMHVKILGIDIITFIVFLLAIPIQFVWGIEFHVNAIKNLKHGNANMDVLVSVTTNIAFFYSVVLVFLSAVSDSDFISPALAMHFFAMCPILITVMLGGKWVEARAKRQTLEALNQLDHAQPQTATMEDGTEIALDLVQVGDILKLVPGSRIPVDGVVVQGNVQVDESIITGESIPVPKKVEDQVLGGTVVCTGSSLIRATVVGDGTCLGQIVSMVHTAMGSKSTVQRTADKVARVFVPSVMGISVIVFMVWTVLACTDSVAALADASNAECILFALRFGMATMMIACPCAMGLATPTAVSVATGVAASRHGCFVKRAEAFELGHRIKTVIFDKTGTITAGIPSIHAVAIFPHNVPEKPVFQSRIGRGSVPVDYMGGQASDDVEQRFWSLVGSAEQNSEHPLGKSIVTHARRVVDFVPCTQFQNLEGRGLETTLDCQGTSIELRVGNEKYFQEHCVDQREQQLLSPWIQTHQDEACTVVIPHINGRALGAIALRDKIQPGADDVISYLKSRGIRVVMLTGDHNRTAQAIANEVGVDEVVSNALPSDKVECVKRCQEDGRVCMVGDGINDAPAMSQADLGVAIGAGSFLTTEAADVVLVRSDLKDFFAFYTLCRSTVWTIYRNFVWAFIFNFVSLPIAAGLFYPNVMIPPLYAGIAMGFSSVLVVTSSLFLRRFTPPNIKSQPKNVKIPVPTGFGKSKTRKDSVGGRFYEVALASSDDEVCNNV